MRYDWCSSGLIESSCVVKAGGYMWIPSLTAPPSVSLAPIGSRLMSNLLYALGLSVIECEPGCLSLDHVMSNNSRPYMFPTCLSPSLPSPAPPPTHLPAPPRTTDCSRIAARTSWTRSSRQTIMTRRDTDLCRASSILLEISPTTRALSRV